MAQVFPDFALAGQGSPSRYRRYESGRGLNHVECDHNLAAVLDLHLDEAARAWAGNVCSRWASGRAPSWCVTTVLVATSPG